MAVDIYLHFSEQLLIIRFTIVTSDCWKWDVVRASLQTKEDHDVTTVWDSKPSQRLLRQIVENQCVWRGHYYRGWCT